MEKQKRVLTMAITLGCLMVACSALADGANSGSNGINTNPGSGAGTQGAGGVLNLRVKLQMSLVM